MSWDSKELTIAQVKKHIQALREKPDAWCAAIERLKQDPRKGIKLLYEREARLYQEYLAAVQQQHEMLRLEQQLWQQGFKHVAGVDEAGRGPLAGPVVAAAVILPEESLDDLAVQDSKQIQHAERQRLYLSILNRAVAVGVGVATPRLIDSINILQATLMAMRQAVNELPVRPDIVLVDGRSSIPNCTLPQRTIVKGDQQCRAIAAASIVAKVYRDRLMEQLHRHYPQYGFAENKGYPTVAHRAALRENGKCSVHRLSFGVGEH